MNAKHLIALFERVADDAQTVPHLRRLVVDLAVRGLLAEGYPRDGDVAMLISEVAEHSSLGANSPYVTPGDDSIDIPDRWRWVKLGAVTRIVMGQSPPGASYNKSGDGVPLINGPVEFTSGPFGTTVVNQYTTQPKKFCELGDFLLCVRGSTTGRTNVAGFRACIGRGVAAIQPLFPDHYIRMYVAHLREQVIAMGRGIAFPSISRQQIEHLAVPLPPREEQTRIVARVEELMTLCDELEDAQQARERRRDRLATTAQRQIVESSTDEEKFGTAARFYLQRADRLITKPEHIAELRRTILDLAVRGSLVAQDADAEGTGEELLREIRRERAKLPQRRAVAQKLTASDKGAPFAIPANWTWTTLGEIADLVRGVSFPASDKSKEPEPGLIPCFRSGNIQEELVWDSFIYVPRTTMKSDAQLVRKKDILLSIANSYELVGKSAIVHRIEEEATFGAFLAAVRLHGVQAPFMQRLLSSSYAAAAFRKGSAQTTNIANITFSMIRGLPVAIPPAAEQARIVAKVEQLMALCDELEEQLAKGREVRNRLLDSVIHAALT